MAEWLQFGPASKGLLLAAGAALAGGCGWGSARPAAQPPATVEGHPLPAAQRPWFADQTTGSGIDFTYATGEEANRYTLLESLGGGVGLIDFDGDGRLDIVLPGGGGFDREGSQIQGRATRLFRNLGDWKFADVTESSGLDQPVFYAHGCAVADYDRDGWCDLVITGYDRLALYHNESDGQSSRKLVEVTSQAGLDDQQRRALHWSTSAAWGDLDGDGYPDLYVCHYADWSFENHPICPKENTPHSRDVCPPQRFQPLPHTLYRNLGDGTFLDASAEQGLRTDGCGLGVVMADLDGNAQPDLYVGNDATPNFLYLNRHGRLEECAQPAGVAFDELGDIDGSMGVDVADFDGSGRPSLWVTNFQEELHALYANLGNGFFRHQSKAAGIAALGRKYVGFGTGFFDADGDGWEDLIIVNGHVLRYPIGAPRRQKPVLLQNVERDGRRMYQSLGDEIAPYFQRELLGRGLAIGDLDNDGRSDLVISHSNSPAVLLRNVCPAAGQHHWLGVELIGKGKRDIVGSTVTLDTGNRRLVRFAKGGGSYLSSSDRRLLFGFDDREGPVRVSVRWSWGNSQTWENLQPGAYYRLREGDPFADLADQLSSGR